MVGRPTKKTPRTEEAILKALGAGNTRRASCQYAGISEDTFANWLKASSDFSEAVQKAEADAEVRHVANIAKAAGDGTWTASAWWLERRRHGDWGKKDEVTITIKQVAERLAAEQGLDAADLIAEAERIVSAARA